MGARLLEVDAKAIKFICEVKKQSTTSVHLSNISDEYVAFKVKTTSPKRFCVRPNSGIISPKSACDFSVTMQGLRSPASEVECKDKFLIQSTVVDAATKEEDVTLDLFSKSSGKYVEEKKLRVILISKEDSLVEEQKNKKQDSPVEEHKNQKQDYLLEEHKNKKQDSSIEEHKHKKQDSSVEEHKHKKQDSPVEEHNHKKQDSPEHKNKKQDSPVEEHKHKKQDSPVEEHKHKHKKKGSPVEDHKNKVLEQEPSNESLRKEEKLLKRDEHVSPKHMRTEDVKEVKSALPKEEPKPSGDLDGNERNVSKNLKFNPVKVVKEDPQKKLRLCNQLKDLKLKESTLENQLKEAKSTISSLTYQNSKIIEAKEILQLELARRSKKGFSFVSVCLVSLVGVIVGYFSQF
ncbi:vesicle-associated protein 2-2-like [Cynara cardunculus var. scolymus]|uniref:vesicle-associated protein 2-2-like n=1 Tax=Cynara cardunculus var. scolymus TaxID=59895 RepID=UPI000D62EA1D|nr:vesicle-associated protein 2-2-like [Cynara cardunculus var. scolymus]